MLGLYQFRMLVIHPLQRLNVQFLQGLGRKRGLAAQRLVVDRICHLTASQRFSLSLPAVPDARFPELLAITDWGGHPAFPAHNSQAC